MKVKIGIAVGIVLLVLAGGLAAFWPFGNGKVLRLPGVVEIQEVRLGSKVGGRVEDVLVKEGVEIYKGQQLVIFEAPELKNQHKQMQAKLDGAKAELDRIVKGRPEEIKSAEALAMAAKAKWDRALFGWRKEEKQQAENDLKTAEADYDQALKEWNRVDPLFREKAVSQAEYDAARAAKDKAHGRKESAWWRNDMLTKGARPEDKEEAKQEYNRAKAQWDLLNVTQVTDTAVAAAKVAEYTANLEAIDINLAETILIAPPNLGKARVEVLAVRPGDLVLPNQPVVRVLRTEDLWVKVYVPETQYGLILKQQKVVVTIDSFPGKIFKGEVEQKNNIAEFTPRNVQSVDERRHQVFGVKIRVTDAKGVFSAGMAAEVVFPLD